MGGPIGWIDGLGSWPGPMGLADGLGLLQVNVRSVPQKSCLCLWSSQYLICEFCFLSKVTAELLQKSTPLGHSVMMNSSLTLFLFDTVQNSENM